MIEGGTTGRRLLVGALAAQLVVALACKGDDDDDGPIYGPEAPIPTLVAADTTVILRPGETTSLTWTVEWPDGGERPEDVVLQVAHDLDRGFDDLGAAWRVDFVHGETVTYTFTAGEPQIYWPWKPTAWVTGASVVTPVPVEGALRIQVIGGPADAVFPPVDRIDLGVGEVRPFTAYAAGPFGPYEGNPNPNFGQRRWSDDPLGFAVDDPAVATVTAHGVITALAEGETTLRITAGEAQIEVPLAVDDVPLGPPPPGAVPVFEHAAEAYNVTWAQPDGPLETKAALDALGWPMLVVTTKPGLGPDTPRFEALPEPTVLARWTGTGFGYETLPVPPHYRFPVLSVAADGHVYLLLHEDRSDRLVLWDRPGDVVTGGWRERELPWGVDVGDGPLDLSEWSEDRMDWIPVAVLPREAGGVWLAIASHHDLESDAGWCPVVVRLVAATPDALEVHPVATLWKGFDSGENIDCDAYFTAFGAPVRMALLPTDVGSPFPTVVMQSTEEPGITEWRAIGGAWEPESVEVVNPTFDLVWDDIAPVIPVEGPDDLLRVDESPVGHVAWRGPRGELFAVETGPDPAEQAQAWADGDPLRDEPLSWWTYLGHATDRERLYLFADGGDGAFDGTVQLHTERMPWAAHEVDPDALGRRLPADPVGFRAQAAHALSGGARVVRHGGRMWASAGTDAPWALLDPPVPGLGILDEAFTWIDGDTLRFVRARPDAVTGEWSEYAWDGLGWSTARSFVLPAWVEGAVGRPEGGAWLTTVGGGAVLLPADPDDPLVTAPQGTLRPGGVTMTGLAPHPDGGVTVVTSLWDRCYVTSIGPDGTVRRAETEVALAGTMGHRLIRTATGRLLMPGEPDWLDSTSQGLWVSDDDGVTWTWKGLGDAEWSAGMVLLRLPGDRLALVGTKGHGWNGHQAAVATSDDDGATWSEPTWVRPDGGTVQFVGPVAADAAGDLIVWIDDGASGLVPTPQELDAESQDEPADVLVEVTP